MENIFTTFANAFITSVADAAPGILKKIIILVILWISFSHVKKICFRGFKKFISSKKLDELLVNFLESLLNITIIIFYVLFVIQVIGMELTSVIALLSSVGIGVGLALKGSLSDLAGGLQILASRYFTKGDFIITCGVQGVVQKITFLYTILYTSDNKFIIIPNGKLSNDVITNVSANSERRVDFIFSVAYDSSIDRVKEILLDIAGSHPLILKEKNVFTRLQTLNSSSLDFVVRVWTKKEDYWTVFFDIQESVKKVFDEEGIEIPYQKLDVYTK